MRYNIFNAIHKALKAISYDTAIQIQRTNFLDKEETDAMITELEQTLSLLDLHIEHESTFIHPLLEKVDIDIDRRFREKHIETRFLAEKVKISVKEIEYCHTQDEKIEKGKSISNGFEALMAHNLTLFVKEEQILNQMLWGNYHDNEIIAIEQQIIASVPQDTLQLETIWLMRSLNNFEIGQWLMGAKQSAPGFVFDSLLSLAKNELPTARFKQLLAAFSIELSHEYSDANEHNVLNIF